jgi:hypothetical protein
MTADPRAAYEQVRDETRKLLGLGPNPSLLQDLQSDAVSLLRLALDAQTGAVLAGHPVDLGELSDALGMLARLLPANALQAGQLPNDGDLTVAEEQETERLWQAKMRSLATERQRRLAEAPDQALAELQAEIVEAQKRFPPRPQRKPWGTPPQAAPASEPAEQRAAPASEPAAPARPVGNAAKVPAHYLQSDEDRRVAAYSAMIYR